MSKSKTGKGGNVRGLYQRKNGMWCSRIAGVDGKMIRKRLSSDKTTAIAILGEMRRAIDLQRAGILPEKLVKKIDALNEIKQRYLEHIKAGTHAVNTVEGFFPCYNAVIAQNNFVNVSDIKLETINKWSTHRLATGLRGQTINHYVGVIRHFLEWAKEREYITVNPLAHWRPVRPSEPRKRRDLQAHEVAVILDAEVCEDWRLLWHVYFFTGLRRTAGADLRWEWIDWESRYINMPVESNKSCRQHSIPIHPALYAALLAFRDKSGEKPTGRVFHQWTGTVILYRFRCICARPESTWRASPCTAPGTRWRLCSMRPPGET